MANTVTLRAQIDPKLKESAESVLKKLGISTSDAISIFFNSLKVQKGFPPGFKMPNRTTRRAMKDAELGRNLTEWSSKEEFFKALEDL